MASNVVTILSVTLFLLNMFSCIWYALACENTIIGGACKNNTWSAIEHPHESKKWYRMVQVFDEAKL